MLCFNRIDVSEEIDVNKTGESKDCGICHYWYLLDKVFQFQSDVCIGCHDLLMMSMHLNNIANLKVKGADYRIIISGISKTEVINLLVTLKLKNIDFLMAKI